MNSGLPTLGVSGWRLREPRTGIGRYLSSLLRSCEPELTEGLVEAIDVYAPPAASRRCSPLPDGVRLRPLGPDWPELVWENARLPRAVRNDVLLCPAQARPLLASTRTVVVAFEANLHVVPQFYPFVRRHVHDRLYRWSARNATLVVVSSDAARRDVAECYDVPEERIRVVPLAPAAVFRPLQDERAARAAAEAELGLPGPFVLCVGSLSGRRGARVAVAALAELRRRNGSETRLVLVGRNEARLDVARLAAESGLPADAVLHRSFVADETLNVLANTALAAILPYAYESGFSLVAAEAQAAGTPVVSVATPGVRETTGDAALLVERADPRLLADALTRVEADAQLRADLTARGLANVRRYSWRRCAAETLSVVAEAAAVPRVAPDRRRVAMG